MRNHDNIFFNPFRNLETKNKHNIKIRKFLSNFFSLEFYFCLSNNNLADVDDSNLSAFKDEKKQRFLSDFIIPEGVKILEDLFKIESSGFIPQFKPDWTGCSYFGELDIDPIYSAEPTQADFILFVGVKDSPNNNWLAFASFCAVDQKSHRPVAGFIMFNESKVKYTEGAYLTQLETFLHEAFHVLFFHPILFERFPPNSKGLSFMFQDDKLVWKLRGDSVLREAREYFDCAQMDGVPLENQGSRSSAGSHFEKVVFADELMTPDEMLKTRISKFSLAVAQDSGYYEVDLAKGESIFWGKNEGCSFVDQKCSSEHIDEFCSKANQVGCSDNSVYRTSCTSLLFTGTCKVNLHLESCKSFKPSKKIYASYGKDAFCLRVKVKCPILVTFST